jgi:hypothetical protein
MSLWPNSAKRPVVAFHLKLMELAEALVLECQVSLQKFCDMLDMINKSSLLPKWVNLYYFFSISFGVLHAKAHEQ